MKKVVRLIERKSLDIDKGVNKFRVNVPRDYIKEITNYDVNKSICCEFMEIAGRKVVILSLDSMYDFLKDVLEKDEQGG